MTERLSLIHDGVEMVDYPIVMRKHVARAAGAWRQFVALDQSAKDLFAAASLQSGTGYEQKGSGQRESRDIKENFDITRDSLTDLLATSSNSPIASRFIAAASNLFKDLESLIVREGTRIENHYGVAGFAEEASASASSVFIRFLHYPPAPTGAMIGEPHVDHSGFTLHLYESTDGCERLTFDTNTWLPMPVSSEQAALFASMQTQLFSQGEIKGLCHRILASSVTARIGRESIVGFAPLVTTPSYDRATHGRLQEMTPGFNYMLSDDEFRTYFTSIQK